MTALPRPLMDHRPATPAADRGPAEVNAPPGPATAEQKKAWFEQAYTAHYRVIFGYLRARTLDHADADDLTQEVFLRFYAGLHRYDPHRNEDARPWLRGISRNVLREHIRKIKRRSEVGWTELCLELDALVGEAMDEDDRIALLPTCIGKLGDSAKRAIRSHYMQGKKLKVIAEEMGRTLGAVKVLMVRSRQALRNCVQAEAAKASRHPGPTAEGGKR